jgi:Fanconi anemia group D2 protein
MEELALPTSTFTEEFLNFDRLLKSIQQSTRYLQHVCQHSKTNKDVSLSNHVPAIKKSLETFVFRVKVTLALNHAVGSFWVGTLKNR